MASVPSNFRTFLMTKSGVTSVFGASPNSHIFVDRVPENIGTLNDPYAILRYVTGAPLYSHGGAMPESALVQVDVYGSTQTLADNGRSAIETAISGYKGTMGSLTVGSALVTDKREQYGAETRTFLRSMDVMIGQNG